MGRWFVTPVAILAMLGGFISRRSRAKRRDPRDDRIRALDAELRIATKELERTKTELEETQLELSQTQRQLDDAGVHLQKQEERIQTLRKDLRESVRKTRELRSELTDRATENLKSEVKLREVETELSVAQATTDLIATGVLDYSVAPDSDDDETPRVQQANT